jgi:deoxycytidylate deaminase
MVKKSPYELMQLAVDIVNSSEHPSNKVAAVISGRDSGGEGFNLAHTNFWPETIIGKIGIDKRIGDTSGTIHAETACIIKSPGTEGAVICVTDPVCPNCAKNIVEAGISEVYIDHKGFDKDFVNRRREYFQTMSLHICKKAGVPVYKIWRKDRRIEALIGFGETEEFRTEKNFYINSNFTCLDSLASLQMVQRKEDFAIAIGEKDNEIVALIAESGLVYGLDNNKRFPRIKNDESKYNYIIEPLSKPTFLPLTPL